MNSTLLQTIHFSFVVISLVSVLFSLLFSFFYLIQQSQLKHKQIIALFSKLPSLEKLDRYVIRGLIVGAISLFVLLVTGITLAHLEWKYQWYKEQKFIVAIFTWVWVLLTLFLRFQLGLRCKKFFYTILIGVLFLIASCLLAWMV